jgi:hypothetical protein
MTYEDIIKAKEKCYELIKILEDDNLLKIFKYYKGDIGPLINTKCRKDMTCGDIDCVQYDYKKKIFRIIECKRSLENSKKSQNDLLELFTQIKIEGYKVGIYKIIGDPPYAKAQIINIATKKIFDVDHNQLINFLNL